MANSDVLIGWLKDASARAFELEDPNRPGGKLKIDILVDKSTVGVRVRRAGSDHKEYRWLTYSELERMEPNVNPLLCLIDVTIAAVDKKS
jgi:hypothetical protein